MRILITAAQRAPNRGQWHCRLRRLAPESSFVDHRDALKQSCGRNMALATATKLEIRMLPAEGPAVLKYLIRQCEFSYSRSHFLRSEGKCGLRELSSWSPRSRPATVKILSSGGSQDSQRYSSYFLDRLKKQFGFVGEREGAVVQERKEGDRTLLGRKQVTGTEEEISSGSLTGLKTGLSQGEVSSVSKDEINPDVVWVQGPKDVQAEERRPLLTSPGFSFSAAGLLFPYHLGVCECLMQHGYITENTPLAGSSAGALVCAVVAGGVKTAEAMRATKELAADCRANGTVFRLGGMLRRHLESFLPEDAHLRVTGRIRVAVTQVFRLPRGLLVDQFDSREDLINALYTSCYIPGYLAPRPVTLFRNRICIDGGVTMFMPPTAAEKTIKVCAFSTAAWGIQGIEISPDFNPKITNRWSNRQLLSWALEPAEDHILDELFDVGYEDAMAWVSKQESIISS